MINRAISAVLHQSYLAAAIVLAVGLGVSSKPCYGQTENKVVATVSGSSITQDQLDESISSQLLPLQQQLYALRKTALENLVLRTLFEREAKQRGVTIEELRHQLTEGPIQVSEGQVETLFAENAAVFASMSPDEARERIRLDLMNQARMKNYREAVLKLKEQAHVQIVLEEPRLPFNPNIASSPSLGNKTGLVTITEFSDFQCPYCRGSQQVTKRILKEFGPQVRLVFKNLPLDIHTEAFGAARAAFCAGEQDSFWQYHDALFIADVMSLEVFNKIAVNQNLNMPKFSACLNAESSRVAVMKDMQEAKRLGIAGTPSYVVNGKLIRGAIGFEEFKAVIEQEILLAQNTLRTKLP